MDPAPVHAWRALAQIGAVEAAWPLIESAPTLAARGEDAPLSDCAAALALLGPPVIAPLRHVLWDAGCPEATRICFADALARLGSRRPETREEVAGVLAEQRAVKARFFPAVAAVAA